MLARPDRDGALHHDDGTAGQVGRKLVDDRPDGAQVGIARLGRRRADGDEEEVRPGHRLLDVEREPDALARSARGPHRGRARRSGPRRAWSALDALGDDVPDDDLVPEVGEAGPGDEADVAGPEHADLGHAPRSTSGERLKALRYREHRLVRKLVAQRVHDPVRRSALVEHDHVDVAAGREEVVLAAGDPVRAVSWGGSARPSSSSRSRPSRRCPRP